MEGVPSPEVGFNFPNWERVIGPLDATAPLNRLRLARVRELGPLVVDPGTKELVWYSWFRNDDGRVIITERRTGLPKIGLRKNGTIGTKGNLLVTPDPYNLVSRQHIEISPRGTLRDISTNGTEVLQPQVLKARGFYDLFPGNFYEISPRERDFNIYLRVNDEVVAPIAHVTRSADGRIFIDEQELSPGVYCLGRDEETGKKVIMRGKKKIMKFDEDFIVRPGVTRNQLLSRTHCAIVVAKDGRVFLMDMGSANGTRVELKNTQETIPRRDGTIGHKTSAAGTTRGVRLLNEDMVAVIGLPKDVPRAQVLWGEESQPDKELENLATLLEQRNAQVIVAADGMGRYGGGDIYSSAAVRAILLSIKKGLESNPGANLTDQDWRDIINNAITNANKVVGEEKRKLGKNEGGTTIVVAVRVGDKLFGANVGDSRAYVLKPNGELMQLSRDHNLAGLKKERGLRVNEGDESELTNCLDGGKGFVGSHFFELESVAEGSKILLCTDGLSGVVPDEEITRIMCSSNDSRQIVELLIKKALMGGSRDNVTAAVVIC